MSLRGIDKHDLSQHSPHVHELLKAYTSAQLHRMNDLFVKDTFHCLNAHSPCSCIKRLITLFILPNKSIQF